jgi:exosortase
VPTFVSLTGRFLAADSYYSHGFLVPLVSAYLIWRKRKRLKELLPARPCKSGLALLVGGLILHLISTLLKINFGSYFSLLIVLAGLALYLFGKRITRELIFPLTFLIFMIPLPSVIIIAVSFKMKVLAAQTASWTVNLIGIPTTRDGSTIYLPESFLLVGDPCSGLRSLISLLALGTVFTQFISGGLIRKITLFLSSIPIALISNVLRIISLLLVTHIYGERAALGFFHDLSGILVFIFAFIGLIIIMRFLKCQIIKSA